MHVLLESEAPMGRNQQKGRGKRERPNGPSATSPAAVAEQTGRLLAQREQEWLKHLTANPASFTAVELELHEQTRRQADLDVAGLLAKASEQPETAPHVHKVIAKADIPLRPVEKKMFFRRGSGAVVPPVKTPCQEPLSKAATSSAEPRATWASDSRLIIARRTTPPWTAPQVLPPLDPGPRFPRRVESGRRSEGEWGPAKADATSGKAGK